ncbi:SRPBCC family protein [Mucilaginibacter agri]|uniref:SRPBCC domain-containing protein n=1 Tax=Mucilaginibacter agri TaxID=2695265 RepID=A0A965ZH42_9SPHI|nr:SRPBCC domain-containing protein [Mucilaginibacter agri]NCD69631.1 SRPBCC domain-containing protein [Mucilaginibacter agri]
MKNEPFVIERTLNAPVERVWRAITDKNEMKNWYFDIPEFEAEVGCEFSFIGGTEEKQYVHLCTVTEVVPNKKLTHSWRYEGYEGNSFVTFELFPEDGKTRLKLTHEGIETFPPLADFAKENFAEGWTYIIGTSIKDYIEGK